MNNEESKNAILAINKYIGCLELLMLVDSDDKHLSLKANLHTIKCMTADVIKDFPEHERPYDYKSHFPIMDALKKATAEGDADTMMKLFEEMKR